MPCRPRVVLLYLVAVAAPLVLGCAALPLDRPAQRPSPGPTPPPSPARAPALEATHTTTPSYDLRVEPPPPVMLGRPGTAIVQIRAKSPYEITHDFPARLRVRSGAVQLDLGRAAATVETRELTFTASLRFAQAGRYPVSGTVQFSLCDKHTCLRYTEAVQWMVSVQRAVP